MKVYNLKPFQYGALVLTILCFIMVIMMPLDAVAATRGKYEREAEQLKVIGVFQGTSNGFELDRKPTRLEGLVMLIRLLGHDADAKKLSNEKCVFEDVPSWGKGYANYAYKSGLTMGVSATRFGASDKMSAEMYVTFMLRALGYQDSKGDFSYAKSIEYAIEKGMIDSEDGTELKGTDFVRDHVAKLSMAALNAKAKGKDKTLLQTLVGLGVITDTQVSAMSNVNSGIFGKPVTTGKVLDAVQIGELSSAVVLIEAEGFDGEEWTGSGFYCSADGKIVTNFHVINGAKKVSVTNSKGVIIDKNILVIGYDERNDIVLLETNQKPEKYIELGDSKLVKLGQDIYAIGSPLGIQNTLSSGIVSQVRTDEIQITAPISSGSSGGVLLNNQGKAIGITTAAYSKGSNIGIAIPIEFLMKLKMIEGIDFEKFYKMVSTIDQPKNVTLKQIDTKKIQINWDPVANAEHYEIFVATEKNGPYEDLTNDAMFRNVWLWDGEKGVTYSTVRSTGTYYFKIVATRGEYISDSSEIASITYKDLVITTSPVVDIQAMESEDELGEYLLDKCGTIQIGTNTAYLEAYNFTIDKKGNNVLSLFVSDATLPNFMEMNIPANRAILEAKFNLISYYASLFFKEEVYIGIFYFGESISYPNAFSTNKIYDNTVAFNKTSGNWDIFYPFCIGVYDDSGKFYTVWDK